MDNSAGTKNILAARASLDLLEWGGGGGEVIFSGFSRQILTSHYNR
jgi:hypothetical protein